MMCAIWYIVLIVVDVPIMQSVNTCLVNVPYHSLLPEKTIVNDMI